MALELDPNLVRDAFAERAVPVLFDAARKPVRVTRLGLMDVPSGRLHAYEPFGPPEGFNRPLDLEAPSGRWPVDLALVVVEEGHLRVGYMRRSWSDAEATAWRMALRGGDDASSLGDDEFFGHGADGGLSGFVDDKIGRRWSAIGWNAFDVLESEDFERGMNEQELSGPGLGQGALINLPVTPPGNFAVCSAGWGDGHYPSFVGQDAQGRDVALLTEYFLIGARPAEE